MHFKTAFGSIATGLLLSAGLCLAQSANDTQQQIAQHNRKLQQYLKEKKTDLAIPELQSLIALEPGNADAHGNLGVLFFFKGDCTQAAPQLRTATTQREGLWRIQVLLGLCERRTGDTAGARTAFEAAFPHLEDEKLRLEAGMELIDLYAASGDLDKAAAIVEQLRAHNPTNTALLYAAYRVYSQQASEAMLSLSMVDPNSAQMHRMMAQEETRQGNTVGAIAQYRQAIAIDPHLSAVHFELAKLLNTSHDAQVRKEALPEFQLALADNPRDEKTERSLAAIDLEDGKTEQAFEEYSKAVAWQPQDADAKLGLAIVLIQMNQPEKALPLLQQTIQLEPANADAHYRLGLFYRKQGRLEDAKHEIDLYRKYKEMREKLSGLYKEMQIRPSEIQLDDVDKK